MRVSEHIRQAMLLEAMSKPAALKTLGFHPSSAPTESEITKAHQELALKYHPDRGGDQEKMKIVNQARDTLFGRMKSSPPSKEDFRPDPGVKYRGTKDEIDPPKAPEPPKAELLPWDEAANAAGVHANATWLFRTDSAVKPQKEGPFNEYTWIVFGKSSTNQYAVQVTTVRESGVPYEWEKAWDKYVQQWERFQEVNPDKAAKLKAPEKKAPRVDTRSGFEMEVMKFPLTTPLEDVVSKAVTKFFGTLHWKKTFGVFPKGTKFEEKKIHTWKFNWRPIKDVLSIVQSTDPMKAQKLGVTLEAHKMGMGEHEHWQVVVTVGNEEHTLSDASSKKMDDDGILKKLWPSAFSASMSHRVSSLKAGPDIMKRHKDILVWMSQHLTGEPEQFRWMLKAAADQS